MLLNLAAAAVAAAPAVAALHDAVIQQTAMTGQLSGCQSSCVACLRVACQYIDIETVT